MTQHIRLSQFIFTYGPGAILEGRAGPRMILSPELGLDLRGKSFSDFELHDVLTLRLIENLPGLRPRGKVKILKIPSNAELGVDERGFIYRTKPFPRWRLCLEPHRDESGTPFYVLFGLRLCPVCKSDRRTDVVRFVRACPAGHLDDVDWYLIAHQRKQTSCRQSEWFKWQHAGGALRRVEIECWQCRSKGNMGWAWGEKWPCSGRYPEREPERSELRYSNCTKDASIIQRQASNLRIPEVITVFSVRSYTELHRLLQRREILSNIVTREEPIDEKTFRSIIKNLSSHGYIGKIDAGEIDRYSWEEIRDALRDLREGPSSMDALLLEEFSTFIRGSVEGIPPKRQLGGRTRTLFEIDPNLVRHARGPRGSVFRVVPVPHLRTVAVQIGYRRMVGQGESELVSVHASDPSDANIKWYPGVEFLGEGIFVMMNENESWRNPLQGRSALSWMQAFEKRHKLSYPRYNFRTDNCEELHPAFVWWHSLAHALIREISLEAGYSSATMRERIYLEFKQEDNLWRGGIIIYTTGPETESALGGLVSLAPYFEDILRRALQTLQACSNDPLCSKNTFREGEYAGAACYACLFLSETSCEHRNMWLDRNVVLENLP